MGQFCVCWCVSLHICARYCLHFPSPRGTSLPLQHFSLAASPLLYLASPPQIFSRFNLGPHKITAALGLLLWVCSCVEDGGGEERSRRLSGVGLLRQPRVEGLEVLTRCKAWSRIFAFRSACVRNQVLRFAVGMPWRHRRRSRRGAPRRVENSVLERAVQNHVGSFNELVLHGLDRIVAAVPVLEIEPEPGTTDPPLIVRLASVTVGKPRHQADSKDAMSQRIFPSECRSRHSTYAAPLSGKFEMRLGSDPRTTSCT